MLFLVHVFDATVRSAMESESRRRLRFATGRFQKHIRELSVSMRDVNGPRGGIDKSCKLTATLRAGTIEIEETRRSFGSALQVAAKRLRRSLARLIHRGGNNRRWRPGREPFRRPKELR